MTKFAFMFAFLFAMLGTIQAQQPCVPDSAYVYTLVDTEPEMLFEMTLLMDILKDILLIISDQFTETQHKFIFLLVVNTAGFTELVSINNQTFNLTQKQKSEIDDLLSQLMWKPATCNNLNVSVYVSIPLRIHLD